jgi:hypothetical protein
MPVIPALAEAGGSKGGGQPRLHSKFKISLGYMATYPIPVSKKKKKTKS